MNRSIITKVIKQRGAEKWLRLLSFGGSSLASAEQFAKVGDIIRADESRKYVVPSAPGKRNSKDTKGNGYAVCMLCIGGGR